MRATELALARNRAMMTMSSDFAFVITNEVVHGGYAGTLGPLPA